MQLILSSDASDAVFCQIAAKSVGIAAGLDKDCRTGRSFYTLSHDEAAPRLTSTSPSSIGHDDAQSAGYIEITVRN